MQARPYPDASPGHGHVHTPAHARHTRPPRRRVSLEPPSDTTSDTTTRPATRHDQRRNAIAPIRQAMHWRSPAAVMRKYQLSGDAASRRREDPSSSLRRCPPMRRQHCCTPTSQHHVATSQHFETQSTRQLSLDSPPIGFGLCFASSINNTLPSKMSLLELPPYAYRALYTPVG